MWLTSSTHPFQHGMEPFVRCTVGRTRIRMSEKGWHSPLSGCFAEVMPPGQWFGPPGSPIAFETEFGWVPAGRTDACPPTNHVVTCPAPHVMHPSSQEMIYYASFGRYSDSLEERTVVHHFETNHSRTANGRFVVPLPKKSDVKPLGESRSQAVRRFLSLEHLLHTQQQFEECQVIMKEYFNMGHAEIVPDWLPLNYDVGIV